MTDRPWHEPVVGRRSARRVGALHHVRSVHPGRGRSTAMTDQPDLHDWEPLVADLDARRRPPSPWAAPSGSSASGAWASCRSASGSTCCSTRAASWSSASWPTRWTRCSQAEGATWPPTAWSPASATIDGRRVAVVRLRLHRAWPGRWAASARARRPACASWRCASASRSCGCSTRPAPASRRRQRLDVRRRRAPCSASRSRCAGVVPQVAAMLGHCAAGTAYIPALADFIPMVKGIVVDGARRPAPRAGGDRRGRHRGGDGRLRGPHQGVGRRRPRGRRRRGVPRRRARRTCRSSRRTTRRRRRSRPAPTPSTAACEELYKHRADRAPPGLRHDAR